MGVSGVRRGQGLGVRGEKGWTELGLDQHVGLCGVRGQRSGVREGQGDGGGIWGQWGQWGWGSVGVRGRSDGQNSAWINSWGSEGSGGKGQGSRGCWGAVGGSGGGGQWGEEGSGGEAMDGTQPAESWGALQGRGQRSGVRGSLGVRGWGSVGLGWAGGQRVLGDRVGGQ